MKKQISLMFIMLILLQNCRVYHVKSVDIQDAISSEKRVKIHTKDGDKLKFKKVVSDSNQIYGVKKVKGKLVKTPIDLNRIEKIRLHNQTLSIILGAVGTLGITVVVSLAIAIANWAPNFGNTSFSSSN